MGCESGGSYEERLVLLYLKLCMFLKGHPSTSLVADSTHVTDFCVQDTDEITVGRPQNL